MLRTAQRYATDYKTLRYGLHNATLRTTQRYAMDYTTLRYGLHNATLRTAQRYVTDYTTLRLPDGVLKTIVSALVISRVRHCLTVYGNGPQKNDRL